MTREEAERIARAIVDSDDFCDWIIDSATVEYVPLKAEYERQAVLVAAGIIFREAK